ncbi:MAG: hypothetical protein LBU37_11535, partial [Tannerellaceae bacterium]|nr:hypothetical protein [Tannerellaceae bacterium]
MEHQGEVILYQPEEAVRLEVRLEGETVWLNRQQMSELFGRDIKTVGKHINNALDEELNQKNYVAAISRARQIGTWGYGTSFEELQMLGGLASGRTVDREEKEAALNVAFELCDTDLFEQIITRIPRAQERILLAF